jgi:hypothetical protein
LVNIYLSSLLTGDSLIALIITGALLAMKITNK